MRDLIIQIFVIDVKIFDLHSFLNFLNSAKNILFTCSMNNGTIKFMSQAVLQRIVRDHIVHYFETNPDKAFTLDEIHKQLPEQNSVEKQQILSHLRQNISTGKVRVVYGTNIIKIYLIYHAV